VTTRVTDEPADTPLIAAPVIAPRPAPDRSSVGEGAAQPLDPLPASRVAPGAPAGGAGKQDTARPVALRDDAPTLAKTGTAVFSVAFGALLVPAGIVLLMAIGGVAWLLAVRAPLGALRRAWPWRRRG
jgi:predicted phage tail protein